MCSRTWSRPPTRRATIPRRRSSGWPPGFCSPGTKPRSEPRSEEHTSELQSRSDFVCRLLLEKKNPRKFRPTVHGTANYAREELIAELSAAFLSADTQSSLPPRADQADYIAGCPERLRNDNRA